MHHEESQSVIERAIQAAIVPVGLTRWRTIPMSDEELAVKIMNALRDQGLLIVGAED